MGTDKDRETLRGIIDRDRIQREIDRKKAEYVCETVREMMGYGIGCEYEINYSTGVWTFFVNKEGCLLGDVLKIEIGDKAFAEREDLSKVYNKIVAATQIERGWKANGKRPAPLPKSIPSRKECERDRLIVLLNAIIGKTQDVVAIPLEWVEEYNELCERSESRRG